MKIVVCIVVRTLSTRLPLKALRDLMPGVSMVDFLIRNIKEKTSLDSIYLCTSKEASNDILEDVALRNGINIYRGSADDVSERLITVAELEKADILVRITGDNPLTFVEYIPDQINFLLKKKLDYVRIDRVPIGATCDVFTHEALKKCVQFMDPSVSEYLMLFLFDPQHFKCGIMYIDRGDFSNYSLTVDTSEDLYRTRLIIQKLQIESNGYHKVNAKSVLSIISSDQTLPARIYQSNSHVKLPYGKTIPYSLFKEEMERRVTQSVKFNFY